MLLNEELSSLMLHCNVLTPEWVISIQHISCVFLYTRYVYISVAKQNHIHRQFAGYRISR